MRALNHLMYRARIEISKGGIHNYHERLQAIRAADQLRLELIEEGRPIPPSLVAAYNIGKGQFHLTELQELRREREQKFMMAMLQVERRHMPFPDEPPIHFPPAAAWKAITYRKAKYSSFRFS